MKKRTVAFLDASILIARTLRDQDMKARVNSQLSSYGLKVSGTVALQEFKRRVLKDVAYLLTKLDKTKSYMATLNFIGNVLPIQLLRKQRICLLVLHSILPGSTDEELTERARRYCRTLLVHGEATVTNSLDSILPGIQCYWARIPVREKKKYVSYELSETRCSKSRGQCQIGIILLQTKKETCAGLLGFLNSLPPERMTSELTNAREFLTKVLMAESPSEICAEDPCLKVGDALSALESEGIRDFYTMNYKESQAFCDFFQQDLTIRPNNPSHDEEVYPYSSRPWPTP